MRFLVYLFRISCLKLFLRSGRTVSYSLIATSWLATGLYIAPAVSGNEPKYQALGVNILFGALVFVVVGSLIGQWMEAGRSSV